MATTRVNSASTPLEYDIKTAGRSSSRTTCHIPVAPASVIPRVSLAGMSPSSSCFMTLLCRVRNDDKHAPPNVWQNTSVAVAMAINAGDVLAWMAIRTICIPMPRPKPTLLASPLGRLRARRKYGHESVADSQAEESYWKGISNFLSCVKLARLPSTCCKVMLDPLRKPETAANTSWLRILGMYSPLVNGDAPLTDWRQSAGSRTPQILSQTGTAC